MGMWVVGGLTVATLLAAQTGEVIDRVLAVVAGDVITQSDVVAARDLGWVTPPEGSDPTRETLTALIDRSLVLAEVERYAPPEPTPDAIDRRLQAVRDRFPTPSAFDAALARAGLVITHVRERVRQDLRVDTYLDERFATAGRDGLVRDWIAGLRRRADVVDLYRP